MNIKKQNNSWINSLNQAKKILNITGFHLVKKNTELYSLAKKIQSGGSGDSLKSNIGGIVTDVLRKSREYNPITHEELYLLITDLVYHVPANLEEQKESSNLMIKLDGRKDLSEILREYRIDKQQRQLSDLTKAQLEEIDYEDYTSVWSGSVTELRRYRKSPENERNIANYLPLIDLIKKIETKHDQTKVTEFKSILASFFDSVYKLNLDSKDILPPLRAALEILLTQLLFDPFQTIGAFKAIFDFNREYVESGIPNSMIKNRELMQKIKDQTEQRLTEFSQKYKNLWQNYQKSVQTPNKFSKTELNLCNHRYEKIYLKKELLKLNLKEQTKMVTVLQKELAALKFPDSSNIDRNDD